MPSMYEPLWDKLKRSKTLAIELQDPPDGDMAAAIKRVRKALSNRKQQDYKYQRDHPHARIEIASKDLETGKVTFELMLETLPFSLSELNQDDETTTDE